MSTRAKTGNDLGKHEACQERDHNHSIIPGYTGYIPGGHHFFGERYAVLIKRAKEEQNKYITSSKKSVRYDLTKIKSPQCANRKVKLPLKPIAEKAKMYFPKAVQHSVSPYRMGNDEAGKHFIAGYTGFVPRARQYMGLRYPVLTNKALCEFNDAMKDFVNHRDKQIDLNRKIGRNIEAVEIYHPDSGMVPCYTGHVQGAKFKFGKGFGASTKEAICKSKQSVVLKH